LCGLQGYFSKKKEGDVEVKVKELEMEMKELEVLCRHSGSASRFGSLQQQFWKSFLADNLKLEVFRALF